MASDKYEILIHDTFGEDFSFIADIERHRPMFYPTLKDTMDSIGPLLAQHYERFVHTHVLNCVDLKNYRVVEFLVDGTRAHVAVIRQVKNSLTFKS